LGFFFSAVGLVVASFDPDGVLLVMPSTLLPGTAVDLTSLLVEGSSEEEKI